MLQKGIAHPFERVEGIVVLPDGRVGRGGRVGAFGEDGEEAGVCDGGEGAVSPTLARGRRMGRWRERVATTHGMGIKV